MKKSVFLAAFLMLTGTLSAQASQGINIPDIVASFEVPLSAPTARSSVTPFTGELTLVVHAKTQGEVSLKCHRGLGSDGLLLIVKTGAFNQQILSPVKSLEDCKEHLMVMQTSLEEGRSTLHVDIRGDRSIEVTTLP